MFARLADFVARHWVLVLLAWVVVPVVVHWLAPSWDDVAQDGDFAFLPSRMTSVRGEELIRRAFPDQEDKSDVVLIVARPDGRLRRRRSRRCRSAGAGVRPARTKGKKGLIAAVRTARDKAIGAKLTRAEGRRPGHARRARVAHRVHGGREHGACWSTSSSGSRRSAGGKDFPKGLALGITGSAAVGADMLFSAEESIRNTEWTTVALVVLILLVVYRAPGLVIVPLVAIFASLELSTGLIALLARLGQTVEWFDFKVFRTTKIFIIVVLYGAATDYCLFLIARYREELAARAAAAAGAAPALASVGHAVTASAMTTILGLGTMIFADFGKFRYGGPTIALSLAVALLACLTLAPALLRAGGRIVFWPFGIGTVHDPDERRRRLGPGALLAGDRPGRGDPAGTDLRRLPAAVGLAGLRGALGADHLRPGGGAEPAAAQRARDRLLRRYYPRGATGPITVLVQRERADLPNASRAATNLAPDQPTRRPGLRRFARRPAAAGRS